MKKFTILSCLTFFAIALSGCGKKCQEGQVLQNGQCVAAAQNYTVYIPADWSGPSVQVSSGTPNNTSHGGGSTVLAQGGNMCTAVEAEHFPVLVITDTTTGTVVVSGGVEVGHYVLQYNAEGTPQISLNKVDVPYDGGDCLSLIAPGTIVAGQTPAGQEGQAGQTPAGQEGQAGQTPAPAGGQGQTTTTPPAQQ